MEISKIDLDSILIDRDVVCMIPEHICLGNCLIAFGLEDGAIHIASKNPLGTDLTRRAKADYGQGGCTP